MASSDKKVAALYVIKNGPYFGILDVDPWDEARDARRYNGRLPVVAHPPCARWGRYWHGCRPEGHPKRGRLGDDGGCFASALLDVVLHGGVLEHPAHSHAFRHFGIQEPIPGQQWQRLRDPGAPVLRVRPGAAWVVEVEQGHYGHFARKRTWLLAVGPQPPDVKLGRAPVPFCKHGESPVENVCKRKREATPPEFRDYLLDYARSCR